MKKGILYFHQGWTDIINCLAMINYYTKQCDKLYLLIREDSKELIDFYTKSISNIDILYEKKINIDIDGFRFICNRYPELKKCEKIGIGYNNLNFTSKYSDLFFVKSFYLSKNIPYIDRIEQFEIDRDLNIENIRYEEFIKKHGAEYILYHEVIENYDNTKTIVNLNGSSNIFFDMIKILENAVEIHLLDSVWGAIVYLLDAKYGLFKNKKIMLYAKRNYEQMFTDPIKLDNWTII